MTSCDCSICFDEITVKTGSTTLSCGHTFHFGCIAKWFLNASEDGPSTCALCRKEMSELEDVKAYRASDDEDDDDDESDDDESDDDEEEERDPVVVQQRLVRLRTKLSSMSEEVAKTFAATKIQSIYRMNKVLDQVYMMNESKRWLEQCEEQLSQAKIEMKVSQEALRLGHAPWRKKVATKVQALWRGYRVRNVSFAMTIKGPLRHHETGYLVSYSNV